MIQSLIDKQDTFEIVRDAIAAILAAETAAQQVLALAASKDPELWKFRVFLERSNPWESLRSGDDKSPIVNVWYEASSYDPSASTISERQATEGLYHIDCYGRGISKDVVGGHDPGDREAAFVVHRILRLVRNILMAGEYSYLGLRRTVTGRWPVSVESLQGELNDRHVENIKGARISLRAEFNEFAPQVVGEVIERVFATVRRTEDGEIVLEADYT